MSFFSLEKQNRILLVGSFNGLVVPVRPVHGVTKHGDSKRMRHTPRQHRAAVSSVQISVPEEQNVFTVK